MNLKNKLNNSVDKISQSKFIAKTKNLPKKLVHWAEDNRKLMYAITMIFLLVAVIVSMCTTAGYIYKNKSNKENYRAIKDTLKSRSNNNFETFRKNYLDYTTLKEYEKEIEQIISKDTLSREDSIRIEELYKIIILSEYEQN